MTHDFQKINELTGFANGDKFETRKQVEDYFMVENMVEIYGECELTQDELDEFAETVLKNLWWLKFDRAWGSESSTIVKFEKHLYLIDYVDGYPIEKLTEERLDEILDSYSKIDPNDVNLE